MATNAKPPVAPRCNTARLRPVVAQPRTPLMVAVPPRTLAVALAFVADFCEADSAGDVDTPEKLEALSVENLQQPLGVHREAVFAAYRAYVDACDEANGLGKYR